jgi:hypothetical protein
LEIFVSALKKKGGEREAAEIKIIFIIIIVHLDFLLDLCALRIEP